MSFQQSSSTSGQSLPHFDSPYPNIIVSDESTPTQETYVAENFMAEDLAANNFSWTPILDGFVDLPPPAYNTPFNANNSLADPSMQPPMQPPMHVLSSGFSLPSSAPRFVTPRAVSPQHATPHAASLSHSEHDKRYWQGFDDGFKTRMTPMLSSENLSPNLRRTQSMFEQGLGMDPSLSPSTFATDSSGTFTAPATPLDTEFSHEIASNVILENACDHKVRCLLSTHLLVHSSSKLTASN